MRAFLVFLLFIAAAIWVRQDVVCRILNLCGDNANQKSLTEVERTRDLTFTVDDTAVLLRKGLYDQFAFNKFEVAPILNENNEEFLIKIFAYLNANPKTDLTIVGKYLSTEDTSSGIYENLGLARAAAVRTWFTKKGLNENRIRFDSQVDDNALNNPLSFSASINQRPDEYNIEAKPQYTFTNMTFSEITFATNSDVFYPNSAFEVYMDSVKTYFDLPQNSKKRITIIGHTDNKGTPKYNLDLGRKRAKSAKKWSVENVEISADKIKTASKGQTEPIISNEDDAGREKNRRVNIKIE
jgi:OOP family OmpA-OmpF porin